MEARISFNPLLLPLEIFLKPLCSFRTWTVLILPPHHLFKGLIKGKVLPRCGRKRTLSDFITFFYLLVFVLFLHYLCVLLLFWVSLVLCFALFNMFLFVYFQFFVCFVFYIKIKIQKLKNKKNTKTVCVMCTLLLVYLGWPLKQSFLNFVSLVT